MIKASSNREVVSLPPSSGRAIVDCSVSAKLTTAPRLLNLANETNPCGPAQETPFDTVDAAQCATKSPSGGSRLKRANRLDRNGAPSAPQLRIHLPKE